MNRKSSIGKCVLQVMVYILLLYILCLAKSTRAGLIFPVGRIYRHLRKGSFAKRIRVKAAVFLTASIQYMVEEVLELAGDVSSRLNYVRVTPRHVMYACRQDTELRQFFQHVIFSQAGTMPKILPEILRKKTNKRKTTTATQPS